MTLRNLLPGALWLGFALGSGTAYLRHGSLLSLAMAVVNLLIAALFILRRPEAPEASPDLRPQEDRKASPYSRPTEIALAWTGTFLPFLLRPEATFTPIALFLQVLGMAGILLSLGALGRSFGVSPARRGVVTRGLYAWVRHPLYATELLYFLGLVIATPRPSNLVIWAALALIQLRRAMNEERCLAEDAGYRDYREAVRYRFVPGLV